MGPTADQQEENAAVVPAIPDKKKGKSVADYSALDPPTVACFPPKMWPVSARKRRKKNKTPATVGEESTLPSMHASPSESL